MKIRRNVEDVYKRQHENDTKTAGCTEENLKTVLEISRRERKQLNRRVVNAE